MTHNSVGHETLDAGVRPIVLAGAALACAIVLAGSLVYGTFRFLAARPASGARSEPMFATDSQVPPEPRIEEHPAVDLQQLHAQEDRTLSTYGWVDKKAGVVRIPVDRALELQLERGFPVRKQQAGK